MRNITSLYSYQKIITTFGVFAFFFSLVLVYGFSPKSANDNYMKYPLLDVDLECYEEIPACGPLPAKEASYIFKENAAPMQNIYFPAFSLIIEMGHDFRQKNNKI
ncbi:hypothetical protein ATE92_1838 [Ulvibacter sp. MAR_2010_11]|uniref:hypothetical protein n=1 Tax=Ulvibacter sp. MAR_2010_11 TaxID=1250229 RepID=UPI000C2B70F2|nr:hypothetical protein [Ulvibacter sp. MAR_2010_11]PKA83673.1 hypothetical protein ATE92_1838 [Ulvibacter sp. MAR_2010_11]